MTNNAVYDTRHASLNTPQTDRQTYRQTDIQRDGQLKMTVGEIYIDCRPATGTVSD